jgi:Methyltransferase domain
MGSLGAVPSGESCQANARLSPMLRATNESLGLCGRNECPACRATGGSRRLGEKNSYTLFECRRCRAVFSHPWPASAEMRDFYDRYYEQAGFVTAPTAIASLERVVKYAERFRQTGRWLDVGYGEGALLSIVQQRGWSCHGVEVSERVLEYGRGRGWAVTSEPQNDPRFIAGSFDVVTMIEFLEHVIVPGRFLTDGACWLRHGGLLYVTTPNIRSLNGRILGLGWSVVSPPEHLVLWSVPALRAAVTKAGFRVFRMRSEGLNPSEVLALTRRGKSGKPVDRNQSAIALSEALARTRTRRTLKAAANAGLNVLRLGDTLKLWARRAR